VTVCPVTIAAVLVTEIVPPAAPLAAPPPRARITAPSSPPLPPVPPMLSACMPDGSLPDVVSSQEFVTVTEPPAPPIELLLEVLE
jgi:hypothetical protein